MGGLIIHNFHHANQRIVVLLVIAMNYREQSIVGDHWLLINNLLNALCQEILIA